MLGLVDNAKYLSIYPWDINALRSDILFTIYVRKKAIHQTELSKVLIHRENVEKPVCSMSIWKNTQDCQITKLQIQNNQEKHEILLATHIP